MHGLIPYGSLHASDLYNKPIVGKAPYPHPIRDTHPMHMQAVPLDLIILTNGNVHQVEQNTEHLQNL
jgi:hypothetical protein